MTNALKEPAQTSVLSVNGAMTAWLRDGRPVVEAIVIETIGAAPVPAGGRMVIASDDDFQGSVSGGCVEADVIAAALDVMTDGKSQTLTFGIGDELAWRSGLPCGSTIRVAVVPVEASAAALIADAHDAVSRDRQRRVIATHLRDGVRCVYDTAEGAPRDVVNAFANGISSTIETETGETFIHVLSPPPRIAIVGATHVAQVLNAMAKAAGYDVVVIDPRSAFTSATRFDAETAITGWPETAIAGIANDPFTAIVTLTHVGHIDDEALKIAMRAPCRYIGALGSRKTHAARVARLKAGGYSDAEIARIHAPIGLKIGGRAPGEIAVSILAEVVAAFNEQSAQ